MSRTRLFLLFIITVAIATHAQAQQLQPTRFAGFYAETRLQPKQTITDSAGFSYKCNRMSFGMSLPLYHTKIAAKHDSLLPGRIGFSLHPSIAYSRLRLSYFPQERILINSRITLSTYYFFLQKNALAINLRAMYNEDEFTTKDGILRYNFSLLYTRKVSRHFSYYMGGAYSYIFGEGQQLPLLGARLSWGKNSSLNMVLPLLISYCTPVTAKTRIQLYAHPQGGINRFENRLNVNDSAQQVLIFRRRGFSVGAAFVWQVRNNVSVIIDPSVLLAQNIRFSSENEHKYDIFIDNKTERTGQLQLKLIWRPWQNTIRNQKLADDEFRDDDNFNLGF